MLCKTNRNVTVHDIIHLASYKLIKYSNVAVVIVTTLFQVIILIGFHQSGQHEADISHTSVGLKHTATCSQVLRARTFREQLDYLP